MTKGHSINPPTYTVSTELNYEFEGTYPRMTWKTFQLVFANGMYQAFINVTIGGNTPPNESLVTILETIEEAGHADELEELQELGDMLSHKSHAEQNEQYLGRDKHSNDVIEIHMHEPSGEDTFIIDLNDAGMNFFGAHLIKMEDYKL